MYLVDTNVVSELRKRRPHGAAIAWLHSCAADTIFLSAATIGELQAGVERTRKTDAAKALEIEAWLDDIQMTMSIVDADGSIFREWARLMQGTSETLVVDALMAATARVQGLTLVTRNIRNFRKFGVPTLNPFDYPKHST